MRAADDPNVDYRKLVRDGYDRCSDEYEKARAGETQVGLEPLLACLAAGSRVLDLGCGAGTPVTALLAQSHRVTGVDFSTEQVRRARANAPAAHILEADLMQVAFEPESFEAVVSFYAIFHLPREEHEPLLRRVYRWLAPGGYFLATVSRVRERAYTEDGFFGVTMYWSNWSREDYERMALEVGFELLGTSAIGHGYSDGERPAERHELLFARKPG